MTIILQNYKKLILNIFKSTFINNIDSIINNFDSINNVNNYINLISSYDDFMCHTLRNSLTKLFEELDHSYRNSTERKAKYYVKSKHNRTILTNESLKNAHIKSIYFANKMLHWISTNYYLKSINTNFFIQKI